MKIIVSCLIKDSKYTIDKEGKVFDINRNRYVKYGKRRGYYTVSIIVNNRYKTTSLHRLLGEYFIPNPNNYNEIDHINRNKLDNRLCNLRWANRSMNNRNRKVFKNSKTGEKYIRIVRGNCYEVRMRLINIRKSFRTLKEAIEYRDKLV